MPTAIITLAERECWNWQTGTFEGRVFMTYGFKSRLAHQNGASDKACSVFFICFFGRRDVSVPPGLGPKCPRCRWASASFCRFAAALARGSRAFLSAKQAEFGSYGEFQIPPVSFYAANAIFAAKPALQALLKLREDFRRVCIRLYLGHHRLDFALLVDEEGRAHDAHRGLAVHLLFLPDAVRLNGGQLRV